MKNQLILNVVLCLCILSLSAEQAYAYLDPGTGSVILQGAIAAIAGAAVVIKLYWHRLLKILGINAQKKSDVEEDENNL